MRNSKYICQSAKPRTMSLVLRKFQMMCAPNTLQDFARRMHIIERK